MRVAGTSDGSLEPHLLPMALANDAVIRDGACIGDPTEGADSKFFASVHHYVRVRVQGRELEAEAVDAQGIVIDTFRVTSAVPDPDADDQYPDPPGEPGGGGCAVGGGAAGGSIVAFAGVFVLVALLRLRRRHTSRT